MKKIDLRYTNHKFEKQNLMTQFDRRGQYDLYACLCGVRGKRRNMDGMIEVDGRFGDKILNCPKSDDQSTGKVIRITNCHASGKIFGNLTPGSEHVVIDPPRGQNNDRGLWVMGVGEPVKVLFGEFEIVRGEK